MKKELPKRAIRIAKYARVKKLYAEGYLTEQIARMTKMSRTWVELVIAGVIPKR